MQLRYIQKKIIKYLLTLALVLASTLFIYSYGQSVSAHDTIEGQNNLSDTAKIRLILQLSKDHYDKGALEETISELQKLSILIEKGSHLQKANRTNLLGSSFLRLGKKDSAKIYLESTISNITAGAFPKEYGYAVSHLAMVEEDMGNLTESVRLYNQAVEILETTNDSFRLAATLNNLGLVYDTQGNFKAALDQYYRALSLFSALNFERAIPSISTNIGKIHYSLENHIDALAYFRRALIISQKLSNPRSQANALNSIGAIYIDMKVIDSAEVYLMNSLKISEPLDDNLNISQAKNNLSKVYKFRKQYDTAIDLNNQALEYARKIDLIRPQIFAYTELGHNYKLKINRTLALINYEKALSLVQEYGDVQLNYNILNELYKYHKGYNTSKALFYFENMALYKDSIINKENLKEITKREMQYAFDKESLIMDQKMKAIEAEAKFRILQNEQQRYTLIFLLVISILIVGFLIMYLNRIKVQKQLSANNELLQKNEIEQLKKEKKILSMNAMIEGQEAERTRIAKDLHDGLGGLLSTVKAHFSNIQSEIQKIEKINVYNKANELVDEACDEVRRISHNLMPGDLRLEGLKTAVQNLGDEMTEAHPFIVNVETVAFSNPMEESRQVFVYRIIQEAMNNIIKHADAKKVLIQLSETDDEYHFIVEDDGKGFDPLQIESGLGLKSMRSRIDFLKGKLDIDTRQGVGTTLSWHIPK